MAKTGEAARPRLKIRLRLPASSGVQKVAKRGGARDAEGSRALAAAARAMEDAARAAEDAEEAEAEARALEEEAVRMKELDERGPDPACL